LAAGQGLIQTDLTTAEHLQQEQKQIVEEHRQPGDAAARTVVFHCTRNPPKTASDFGIGAPHWLLVEPQEAGKIPKVFAGQDEPGGPTPALVGPADSNVQDQPVQPRGRDMRVSEAVSLPWPNQR
jgi:hypothetical protein